MVVAEETGDGDAVVVNVIHEIYEFPSPCFFDFVKGESNDYARRAELWFDTALSYAPSMPPLLRYGKYCGLLYSGCPGERPCDGLDACCMNHDRCVQAKNRAKYELPNYVLKTNVTTSISGNKGGVFYSCSFC